MDVEKTIREYLPNVLHMSLATSVNNKPWVCEVHFVYDDELNLYWRSKVDRRHSQEIAENPNVAGTIVEQHALEDRPRGLYFEGTAAIVHDMDGDDPVVRRFIERLDADADFLDKVEQPDGHPIYKVTVSDWYLFDSRESSPSQKYHLER
jgi:uncharacterized protein YhbP (UPF0306 family)